MTATLAAELVFWTCAALLAYTYLGYPVLIWAWSRFSPDPVAKAAIRPTVSLIVSAYNEEAVIADKLDNALDLEYPRDRLEIILISDGSTDRTPEIGRTYADRGVRVMHRDERRGKSAAMNRAVEQARGEIVFFSDANTFYRPDVVEKMVRSFNDPRVGGVSGRKVVLQDDERAATQGETAFWGYESFLKICESRVGSIVTADGEIFAMRRQRYEPIPAHVVHDDMYQTLCTVRAGGRMVYEDEATSAERASRNLRDEFHLKVRYASAGYQAVAAFRRMLLPPDSLFALQFVSHKLLRWMAPFFLLGLFGASAVPAHFVYRIAFWGQALFYLAGLVGFVLPRAERLRAFYFPLYFCMGNAAALYGFFKFLAGGQSTLWRKAER